MNTKCPGCRAGSPSVVRNGRFYRADDARYIQRFKCRACGCGFSATTGTATCRQKKRRINPNLRKLLCGQTTQREAARFLGVARSTVARRLLFLAAQARARQRRRLRRWVQEQGLIDAIQFDDLITFEHTRCKPLCVSVAVIHEQRVMLDVEVSQIPASGRIAAIARKKYGKRPDLSTAARHRLFERLGEWVHPQAVVDTDAHAHYPVLMRRHFPDGTHRQFKSRPACVTGQGEMKQGGFDPLFWINHTLAMLRANIGRLVRRTWCTTKLAERLADHLALYLDFFNERLLRTCGKGQRDQGPCLPPGPVSCFS